MVQMATRIGVLDQGRFVQIGTPREIYENPVSLHVAGRLGQPRINVLPASVFPAAPKGADPIALRPEHSRSRSCCAATGTVRGWRWSRAVARVMTPAMPGLSHHHGCGLDQDVAGHLHYPRIIQGRPHCGRQGRTGPGDTWRTGDRAGRFCLGPRCHRKVVERLTPTVGSGPHVALMNNLGGTTPLEMAALAEELIRSRIGKQARWMIGPAPMMIPLDMHGFSVSLFPATAANEAASQSPVGLAAWPGCNPVAEITLQSLPIGLTPIQPIPSGNDTTRALIERCCDALIAAEADLNALDAKSGDGDTGSTLATPARALLKAMDRLPLADHTQLYRAIGLELGQTMGGSSGVLLAIFFAAARDASASGATPVEALKAGLERVQQVGGALRAKGPT